MSKSSAKNRSLSSGWEPADSSSKKVCWEKCTITHQVITASYTLISSFKFLTPILPEIGGDDNQNRSQGLCG